MKVRLKVIPLFILLSLGASCLAEDWDTTFFGREPAQDVDLRIHISEVKAQPLHFRLPAQEDAQAWKRAHDILDLFGRETEWCSLKPRISTDDLIEIDPTKASLGSFQDVGFLYRITRIRGGDMTDYAVSFAPFKKAPSPVPSDQFRAQVIAYFIVNGQFMKGWAESLVRHFGSLRGP